MRQKSYLSILILVLLALVAASCDVGTPNSDPGPESCPSGRLVVGAKQEQAWRATPDGDIFTSEADRSLSVWRADHASVAGDRMELFLSKCLEPDECRAGGLSHAYVAGELLSRNAYASGRWEATFKAVKANGVVTSLFTYRKEGKEALNEIDIEILGKDTTEIQLNYWVGETKHVRYIRRDILGKGFDAALQPHKYAIEWDSERIAWYVDDNCVHYVAASDTEPFISHPMYLMLNLWVSNSEAWAGKVEDGKLFPTDESLHAVTYDHVAFYPGQAQGNELCDWTKVLLGTWFYRHSDRTDYLAFEEGGRGFSYSIDTNGNRFNESEFPWRCLENGQFKNESSGGTYTISVNEQVFVINGDSWRRAP